MNNSEEKIISLFINNAESKNGDIVCEGLSNLIGDVVHLSPSKAYYLIDKLSGSHDGVNNNFLYLSMRNTRHNYDNIGSNLLKFSNIVDGYMGIPNADNSKTWYNYSNIAPIWCEIDIATLNRLTLQIIPFSNVVLADLNFRYIVSLKIKIVNEK